MSRGFKLFMLVFFLLVADVTLLGGQLLELALPLVTGWFHFAADALRRVRVDWDRLAGAALWVVLFIAGSHLFFRWIYNAAATDDAPRRPWRWRWTLLGSLSVFLVFAAGTAVMSAVHQVLFMATTDPPMYARINRARADATQLRRLAQTEWEFVQMQNLTAVQVHQREDSELAGGYLLDYRDIVQLAAVEGADGKVRAIVIFHRDPALRRAHGIAVADGEGARLVQDIEPRELIRSLSESETRASAGN